MGALGLRAAWGAWAFPSTALTPRGGSPYPAPAIAAAGFFWVREASRRSRGSPNANHRAQRWGTADSDTDHGPGVRLGGGKCGSAPPGSFASPAQDVALVETLCDKNRMQELARQHGVATAHSVAPRSKEDVARFIEDAVFPVMVKETGGGRLRRRAGGTKFVVRTARELTDFYAKAGDDRDPNLIIQEFIPGEDWMFNGYFDASARCLFGMTGKKIRRFPVNTGVTSLGMCVANETVIRDHDRFHASYRVSRNSRHRIPPRPARWPATKSWT